MPEPEAGRSATQATAKDASRGSATRPGAGRGLARASAGDPTRDLGPVELAFLALAPLGIAAVGLIALLIALIVDVPQTGRTGVLAGDFTAGTAHAGAGLWLELVGGALAIAAGAVAFISVRREPAATPSDTP